MYVDNRFLVPIIPPFVFVGFIRLLFWLSGAELTRPDAVAFGGFVFFVLSLAMALAMFSKDYKIGGFWVGRRK